jgi:hypothetical protein
LRLCVTLNRQNKEREALSFVETTAGETTRKSSFKNRNFLHCYTLLHISKTEVKKDLNLNWKQPFLKPTCEILKISVAETD